MTATSTNATKARAPRTSRTNTNVAAREAVHVDESEDSAKMSALNRFLQAQEDMLREWGAPSGKRAMVAFGSALIVAFGIGFLGGMLMEALVVTAIALTGSSLIAMLLWVLGLVTTIVVSSHAAAATYAYVASKRVDAHFETAKSWFSSTRDQVLTWFERDDTAPAR